MKFAFDRIQIKNDASYIYIYIYIYIPKTKKFGCVGRGDLISLFFSKAMKY